MYASNLSDVEEKKTKTKYQISEKKRISMISNNSSKQLGKQTFYYNTYTHKNSASFSF